MSLPYPLFEAENINARNQLYENSVRVATRPYVHQSLHVASSKNAVRAATTAALPASTYVGTPTFTLTADANGALPDQDGVTLVNGDRLLVKDQATASQNGIYVVTDVGSAGTPWVLTRAADNDGTNTSELSEIVHGATASVTAGTANGLKGFIGILTTPGSGIDGSDYTWSTTSSGTLTFQAPLNKSGGTVTFTGSTTGALSLITDSAQTDALLKAQDLTIETANMTRYAQFVTLNTSTTRQGVLEFAREAKNATAGAFNVAVIDAPNNGTRYYYDIIVVGTQNDSVSTIHDMLRETGTVYPAASSGAKTLITSTIRNNTFLFTINYADGSPATLTVACTQINSSATSYVVHGRFVQANTVP